MRELLLDLHAAIDKAKLSDLEWQIIDATYLQKPLPPSRKSMRGRPSGGTNTASIVAQINLPIDGIRKRGSKVYRDTEFNSLTRSSYWYRKVLNIALAKINKELDYENESSIATLCNLRHEY